MEAVLGAFVVVAVLLVEVEELGPLAVVLLVTEVLVRIQLVWAPPVMVLLV